MFQTRLSHINIVCFSDSAVGRTNQTPLRRSGRLLEEDLNFSTAASVLQLDSQSQDVNDWVSAAKQCCVFCLNTLFCWTEVQQIILVYYHFRLLFLVRLCLCFLYCVSKDHSFRLIHLHVCRLIVKYILDSLFVKSVFLIKTLTVAKETNGRSKLI